MASQKEQGWVVLALLGVGAVGLAVMAGLKGKTDVGGVVEVGQGAGADGVNYDWRVVMADNGKYNAGLKVADTDAPYANLGFYDSLVDAKTYIGEYLGKLG